MTAGPAAAGAPATSGCFRETSGPGGLMELIEISVAGFRNLSIDALAFGRSTNLVLGPNGAGKTSLLEAAVVLGNLRSFREPSLRRGVRHGESSFRITGTVRGEDRDLRLQLVFESGTATETDPQPGRR